MQSRWCFHLHSFWILHHQCWSFLVIKDYTEDQSPALTTAKFGFWCLQGQIVMCQIPKRYSTRCVKSSKEKCWKFVLTPKTTSKTTNKKKTTKEVRAAAKESDGPNDAAFDSTLRIEDALKTTSLGEPGKFLGIEVIQRSKKLTTPS